jgi:hypothetical protein
MGSFNALTAAWSLVDEGKRAVDTVANWILAPSGGETRQRASERDGSYSRKFHSLESDYVINEVRKVVQRKSNPIISNTSVTVYNFQGSTSSPYAQLPIPPERRLLPLDRTPDTSPTKDTKTSVITVEKALKYREWGMLLHEPQSNESIEIDLYDGKSIARLINQQKRESKKEFIKWGRDGEKIDYHEQSIIFIDYPNFSSKKIEEDVIYGTKSLSLMYASWYVRSNNVGLPIINEVPKEIKYKNKDLLNGAIYQTDFPFQQGKQGNLAKIVGVDDYPITAPDSLLGDDKKETKLESIPQTLVYLLKNLDGLVGQFPLEIEIKDSNLIQSGDQKKTIKIPNLSEGIAELVGLAVQGDGYNQALLNLGFKGIVQSSKNAISGVVAQDYLVAIADYLGFEQKDIKRELEFLITPDKTELTDALKHSKQSFKSVELTDKKDLNDYFVDLLQAAAIIKGSHFQKFKSTGLEGQLVSYLKNLKNEGTNLSDDDWRKFLNNVELGYPDKPTKEKDMPYNRNKSERPRIIDHGKLGG